ncbi:MAG: hypothetical protein JXB85_10520 [Anaerolineales bacterium]|nr:hypothetical protein [Anaerolineales bacterium]
MKTIRVRPVEILGSCPAGLSLQDEFHIEGMLLVPAEGFPICFLALSHLAPTIWQLQSKSRFFGHASCPGCTTRAEEEQRVIFLLGHADKWDLCQAISEYRRWVRQTPEPENAQQSRLEAMQAQTVISSGPPARCWLPWT